MNERALSPRLRHGGPSRRFSRVRRLVRSERGTALIEFALVLLPLALIIFGGIDFGFVFKDYIGVRQGVSDAARQSAVAQFGTNSTCFPGVASAAGGNGATAELMCTVHSLDGIDGDTRTKVAIFVGDRAHSGDFAQGQPITICEEYQLHSVTGILPFINNTVATSTATDMIEDTPPNGTTTPTSAHETPLNGKAWPSICINGPDPTS
jgi:Flp pilus assembly pilin Flp